MSSLGFLQLLATLHKYFDADDGLQDQSRLSEAYQLFRDRETAMLRLRKLLNRTRQDSPTLETVNGETPLQ